MNLKKPRKTCLNCNKECKRHSTIYCSNKCQQEYRIKRLIESWLITGNCIISTSKKHYIKKYILKEQNYKCAICDLKEIWNKKELIFILDHIDGNYKNTNRKNLRLICPNCDSQLSTYKGRNKGNGRTFRK